jgi:hypothetical protein
MAKPDRARSQGDTLTPNALLYQHAKRPEWGYCAIVEVHEDRTTFRFVDGMSRTILQRHMQMMQRVDLEDGGAAEVHKLIAKHSAPRSAKVASAPKSKRAGAKKAAANDDGAKESLDDSSET